MRLISYRGDLVVAGTNALMRECLKKKQTQNWFQRLYENLPSMPRSSSSNTISFGPVRIMSKYLGRGEHG